MNRPHIDSDGQYLFISPLWAVKWSAWEERCVVRIVFGEALYLVAVTLLIDNHH